MHENFVLDVEKYVQKFPESYGKVVSQKMFVLIADAQQLFRWFFWKLIVSR